MNDSTRKVLLVDRALAVPTVSTLRPIFLVLQDDCLDAFDHKITRLDSQRTDDWYLHRYIMSRGER